MCIVSCVRELILLAHTRESLGEFCSRHFGAIAATAQIINRRAKEIVYPNKIAGLTLAVARVSDSAPVNAIILRVIAVNGAPTRVTTKKMIPTTR
jgi:hypothetical protein